MTAPAPHGANPTDPRGVNRVTTVTTPQGEACPTPDEVRLAQTVAKRITGRWLRERRVRDLYRFYQAQARAEAGFVDWLLDYLDPTGEHATNNVLREQAAAMVTP